jgi:hypothetical protein
MLTRAVHDTTDNPLLDSPYNAQYANSLGSYPINNNWLLLDGEHFSQLSGDDWAFLG